MTTHIDQTEMLALIHGLKDREIECTLGSYFNGIQVRRVGRWSAICHQYSYGGPDGLIEVMGFPECGDDVIGYLTAEEVLQLVDKNS